MCVSQKDIFFCIYVPVSFFMEGIKLEVIPVCRSPAYPVELPLNFASVEARAAGSCTAGGERRDT